MLMNKVDLKAIEDGNKDYLLGKGVRYYKQRKFDLAFEYYHLAASLGSEEAKSNLGYCYMYGNGIKKDMSLAVAYFEMAAKKGVVDSLYKLATLYLSGNYVDQDDEMARYYLISALNNVPDEFEDKVHFPSLYYTYAKEILRGELFEYNPEFAFLNLLIAKCGYEVEIENGATFYEKSLQEVNKLLENKMFDKYRDELKELEEEDEDDYDFLDDNPFM